MFKKFVWQFQLNQKVETILQFLSFKPDGNVLL